ncbi:L-histidine N(alpha)-methyltransferase, partial [Acinetobacter baumannii]
MLDLVESRARRVAFHDFSPRQESFEAAVVTGLSRSPKSIPSRFLYDSEGSALFDAITDLPEYYL